MKYRAKIQFHRVFETEIEVEADTASNALDIARKFCKENSSGLEYKQVSSTTPTLTTLDEV